MTEDLEFTMLPGVRSMGTMLFDPCWAEQAHVDDAYEMLYVIDGAMRLVIGESSYRARPGDLLLVPAGTAHRDVFDLDAGLEVFMTFFNWEDGPAYFTRIAPDACQRLPHGRKAEVIALVDRLRHDDFHDTAVDQALARALVLAILMLLQREALRPEPETAGAGQRRRALMEAAKRYIDRHYLHPISLDAIAGALDISTFHLSHIFRRESGFTLSAYLTHLRMEKAVELLRGGGCNVSTAARAVGYEDGNYFAKVFRRTYGRPPSDYLRARGEIGTK